MSRVGSAVQQFGPHNFVALDVLISCEMSWMVDCQNNIVEQSALLNPNKY